MKRTTRMKRLAIDALCAGLIAVLMCAPAFAGTQPTGFVTDDNGLMAYHVPRERADEHGYDFMGYVDGQWRQITYKTSGGSGSDYGYSGFKAGAYHKESAGNLEVTTATPKFIENGKAIQMEYTVTNNGETAVTGYRFYIAADTRVNNNEKSTNTVNGSTVTMTSDGISFFALSKTDGCTIVPTKYVATGEYVEIREGRQDPSTVTYVADPSDSALVMYYPEETLNAGESKTYTLVVGMGKSSEVPDIIDDITGDDTDTTPAEKSPATGDNDSLALWLALLFASGGAVAGTTIASKKRNLNR